MTNLFKNIPGELPEELFTTLSKTDSVLIERIVSSGHTAPEHGWFDQQRNEFVVVLQGAAVIEFDDDRRTSLAPGDWLDIPAHRKHRVIWTDEERPTVWLAVHY